MLLLTLLSLTAKSLDLTIYSLSERQRVINFLEGRFRPAQGLLPQCYPENKKRTL